MPAKNIRNKRKCRHKVAYATKEDAWKATGGLYKDRKERQPKSMLPFLPVIRPYLCEYCKRWHVGRNAKVRIHV